LLVLSFNTAFYQKGVLVLDRKQIAFNYLKTWFLLDLFASFPYSWVVPKHSVDSASDESSDVYDASKLLRMLRIVRFLRILRLLRVLKLQNILIKLEENIASDSFNVILKFAKLIIFILFLAHWIACFFYAIGATQLTKHRMCWIRVMEIEDSSIS